ncbi:type IV protein arginine methyltransferase, partial [Phenoliferia sp. Uapishka_3]
MPAKKQKTTAEPISVTASTSVDFAFSEAQIELALALISTCLADDLDGAKVLVGQGADAWVQDSEGWTALHCAASVGNTEMINLLLRSGNAVWSITDNLGNTAGDLAYSLNEGDAYEALLAEGVRSELIKSAMEEAAKASKTAATASDDEMDGDDEVEGEEDEAEPKLSTASDNETFLKSSLIFTTDKSGQEICVDKEGNGVMMGWEKGIMQATVKAILEDFLERKTQSVEEVAEEELNVVNVGFGLGIIDSFLQDYRPTNHLIIEPHPDVLGHARSKGWYEKPGVRFYEGTWQQYLADLESEKEPYTAFDGVYFDTYSEHYSDLHAFFDVLPNMLRSPASKFSFFHGLGATSRLFYDVYTSVSELHLREIGLETRWEEVELEGEGEGGAWEGVERRYWGDVGPYRLPVCWLDF